MITKWSEKLTESRIEKIGRLGFAPSPAASSARRSSSSEAAGSRVWRISDSLLTKKAVEPPKWHGQRGRDKPACHRCRRRTEELKPNWVCESGPRIKPLPIMAKVFGRLVQAFIASTSDIMII